MLWRTDTDDEAGLTDGTLTPLIGDDIAAILSFDLLFAHDLGLDPAELIVGKLLKNEQRYPIVKSRWRSTKQRQALGHPGMKPAEAQQRSLNELEELSGKPVVLQEDAGLPNLARIQIAAATRPVHVLSYNPAAVPELPYLVCFQCGLAKRALRAAPDERFNVASTDETYRHVEKLVREQKAIPANMISTYSQMITDGLGTQLRSMPIGIRVDRALYHNHPELRGLQRAAAERSMKENLGCLHPSIRAQAPDLFLRATTGMNAAFALAWSRLWNEDAYNVPYRLAGFLELGEVLLDALDAIPDAPTHDRELVSKWAALLKIDDLYQVGPVGL